MKLRRACWLVMALCGWSTGCGKSFAGSLPPDFAGTWDITYDDAIEVEVRFADQVLRAGVGDVGGEVAFRDGGAGVAFEVDCTRPELLCPSEVLPRELALQDAPGSLDDEGVQLARPLAGQGFGRCVAKPGSMLTGEVMSVRSSAAVRPQAVALTSGRATTILDPGCFGPNLDLPPGAQVLLFTGFTAAKR